MNLKSNLKCPHCGYIKNVTMPTDRCVYFFTCEKCHKDFTPKSGDCCVFCSYGDNPCPSIQELNEQKERT
ncbi:MAG: GDCCVxC domain-containing (seleno)protein [Candidatus Izemoplasma sp.]